MQKIAIIEYQDVDEPLLKLFFEKLKVSFKETNTVGSKEDFIKDFQEACSWSNALDKGEVQPTEDIDNLLKDLHTIAQNEENYGHHPFSSI